MRRLRPVLLLALGWLAAPDTLRAQAQGTASEASAATNVSTLRPVTVVGTREGKQTKLEEGERAWEIEALSEQGWAEYNLTNHIATATNGVLFKFAGAAGTADELKLDVDSGDAIADGRVRIQHEDQIWAGEHIRYNFKTRQLEAEQFRTGKAPVFAAGEGLQGEMTNKVYAATNAFVTTDDVADPAIRVRAKYIKIIPGKRIEARNATLWMGGVPVFYFPYYSRNLGLHANNFNFVPGYRSAFGPFLLGSYKWYLNDQLDGILHLDYRQRRGVGGGPDFNYHLGQWGEGTLRYYYLHDQDPNIDASASGKPNPHNRQWVYFSYQAAPATNVELKSVVTYQSDADVVREFYEREYRQTVQQKTFFEGTKFWQNFSLDTYVQPRLNDFYENIERLPDVRLTGYRQQLGATPVYYESESSVGYYRHLFPVTNGPPLGLDYSAARADTYHQLLLPETLFGWLNFTPRAGGRFTAYSQATGPGGTTDDVTRGVFNTGAEVSFKAARVWPGTENKVLDLDGLRHIVEPSVNYVYVPRPSAGTNQLPQFDFQSPSLALLPVEFPDYNSIDSIDSQNVMRFGLRNKLQTKRQGQIEDLLNWELVTDWYLKPKPDQDTFGDVYSTLGFRPRSWLTFGSQLRYDIHEGQFRMALHTLTLQPNDRWSWTFGHWYLAHLADDPGLVPTAADGDNLFSSTLQFRVNENWGLRALQRYDAQRRRMEEQDYSIYRDMRSWTAALTLRLRKDTTGPEDFSVVFTFSIKAMPRVGIGGDRPVSLLGG